MRSTPSGTEYSKLTRRQTLVVLAVTIISIDWCILNSNTMIVVRLDNLHSELYDSDLYRGVASRVFKGENYYDAAKIELSTRGYPTGSVFNWRMPVYAWIFGNLPSPSWGTAILVFLSLVAVAMACSLVSREGGWMMQLAVALMLAGSYTWLIFPQPIYFMEIWSGILITISACFYYHGYWKWGVVAGTLALILRELALPYCATAFILAWRGHRVREVFSWLLIGILYVIVFYFHYREIERRNENLSAIHDLGWIAFGGTAFVLSTCRMSFPLMALPAWCTAVYLPLSLLGLLGWKSREALPIKLTAVAYVLLFSFVGKPYDFYWGWLYTPILVLGVVWSPIALRDIIRNIDK